MGQIDLWGNEEQDKKVLTYEDKIKEAQDVLRLAAEMSAKYYEEPLLICYSGGKDSDVLLHCAESAGISFEVINSHTTVDAPQTVRHIEKVFKRLNRGGIKTTYHNRYPVQKTMWELIAERGIPPSRIHRYCCTALKETTTPNRFVAIGVRADESRNRQGREIFKQGGGTPEIGNNGHMTMPLKYSMMQKFTTKYLIAR